MLVFATSDKGGTGRSVTSCNIAFHLTDDHNVAYVDFDFGSPTAGAIFEIEKLAGGTDSGGMHGFVEGRVTDPHSADVWQSSDRGDLRNSSARANRLVLFPGDRGGAEFSRSRKEHVTRCVELFSRLEREFDVTVVDLSAGRSYAAQLALKATADEALASVSVRWLIFHRWTRQHIVAAHSLIFEKRGLLDVGADAGHDRDTLREAIRCVRTAVPDLNSLDATKKGPQAAWLRAADEKLHKLAIRHELGRSRTLGSTPMEPMLQWREQVISDADVSTKIANPETVQAFRDLTKKLTDPAEWEPV